VQNWFLFRYLIYLNNGAFRERVPKTTGLCDQKTRHKHVAIYLQSTPTPRGADMVIKLVDEQSSGKITGRAGLTLNLAPVKVNGRMVDLNTQTVPLLARLPEAGKGAAVGAASGGAAGTGAEVVTSGQRVKSRRKRA
jgi:hypothetical protein